MKKTLLLLAALLLVASCGSKNKQSNVDPVQQAVIQALLAEDEKLESVLFDSFEKVDSSTFADELLRRKKTFALRARQDELLYNQYLKEGKPKNAQLRSESLRKDKEVSRGLDSLGASLGSRINDIAFYDYVFTGRGIGEGYTVVFNYVHASVTPDCRVLAIRRKKTDLHKTTGKAIPGYEALIKGIPEEEEEEAR